MEMGGPLASLLLLHNPVLHKIHPFRTFLAKSYESVRQVESDPVRLGRRSVDIMQIKGQTYGAFHTRFCISPTLESAQKFCMMEAVYPQLKNVPKNYEQNSFEEDINGCDFDC